MKAIAVVLVILALSHIGGVAAKVEFERYGDTKEMTIRIFGDINREDVRKLELAIDSLVKSNQKLHMNAVQLDSNGGNLNVGMIMGYVIRRYGLNTVVLPDAICHSACVYVLIGGVQRYPFGEIGVHRTTFRETPTTDKNIEKKVKKDIKRIHSYISEMGVSNQLSDAILSTPAWFIRVVSAREKYEWQVMGIERVEEEKLVNQIARDRKIKRTKIIESIKINYDFCLNEVRAFNSTLFECFCNIEIGE